MERQTTFGWVVAADLLLGGLSGGILLVSYSLDLLGKYERISRVGALVAPVPVLMGACLLISDLGVRTRLWKLLRNPSSWMSRGAYTLLVFVIFGVAYSLPAFEPLAGSPWDRGIVPSRIVGAIAALGSVFPLLYPGFFLGLIRSIPFWNTSTLPALFLVSGLCPAIALLSLMGILLSGRLGSDTVAVVHALGTIEIIMLTAGLLLLWAYVEIALHGNVAAVESAHVLLRAPLFVGGAVVVGFLLPLVLISWSLATSDLGLISALIWIVTVFLLFGGLFLRREILKAGVCMPRFVV